MSGNRLDGKALAARCTQSLAKEVEDLGREGIFPSLAVIQVGEDPASTVYVGNKEKACQKAGIRSQIHRLPADTSMDALLERIEALNRDDAVHGILVQLPLPAGLDAQRVILAIDPAKDVDGFHPVNVGALWSGLAGEDALLPCTPAGMMAMLEDAGVDVAGRHCVVVGRSNIVGKPMAALLLAAHATVSICHSRTRDLASITRQGEVVVAAAGVPRLLGAEHIQPGATVLDVGIHRLPDGSLCGDVDTQAVEGKAQWISPVPGGVGPMTIAMLLRNCVRAARRQAGNKAKGSSL